MIGLHIILTIKDRRTRIEPCRADDAFVEQKLSILKEPLVKSCTKWFCPGFPDLSLEQYYYIRKSRQLFIPVYLLLLSTKIVFCQRSFDLFLEKNLSSCFIKWCTYISLRKHGVIVFKPVEIADSKSTLMKRIFFRFEFVDKFSCPNMPKSVQFFFHLW